jgi:hypothetical protein
MGWSFWKETIVAQWLQSQMELLRLYRSFEYIFHRVLYL